MTDVSRFISKKCFGQVYATECSGRESGEESIFGMPSKDSIMDCFGKDPESCSEEEVRGVDIFYNVALASVVPKLKERLISTQSGVLEMLGNDPGRWESSMAYAIVLIDKMSSVENIKENVENLEGNTKKKKRGKMLTDEKKYEASCLFNMQFNVFMRMLKVTETNDERKVMATKKRFREWEEKVGMIVQEDECEARKRKRIHPEAQKRQNDSEMPRLLGSDMDLEEMMSERSNRLQSSSSVAI